MNAAIMIDFMRNWKVMGQPFWLFAVFGMKRCGKKKVVVIFNALSFLSATRKAQVKEVNRTDFPVTFQKLAGNSESDQWMALPSSEHGIVTATSRLVHTLLLTSVSCIFSKAKKVY